MREIGAALALASLLFFQPTLAHTQRGGEPVRIAHAQDFPPLAEVRDGKSEGLAIDILRAAAARADVEVQFVAVPFEQVHLTLADGRAEAVFPSQSLPNVANCRLHGRAACHWRHFIRRAGNVPPEKLAALSGKIVVTPRTGPLAAFVEKTAPTVNLVVTKDYEESLPASCGARQMRRP